MNDPLPQTMGCPDMQEFVEKAITDPAEMARLSKGLRRPRKWPAWLGWLSGAGALVAAFTAGLLLGALITGLFLSRLVLKE